MIIPWAASSLLSLLSVLEFTTNKFMSLSPERKQFILGIFILLSAKYFKVKSYYRLPDIARLLGSGLDSSRTFKLTAACA